MFLLMLYLYYLLRKVSVSVILREIRAFSVLDLLLSGWVTNINN